MPDTISIFWFRRDLRLSDNVGLYHALLANRPVLPLFIFDTDILSKLEDKADRRVDLIHQILKSLQEQLRNEGADILIRYGKPAEVFEQLLTGYSVDAVYCNRDYEPYALKRDHEVQSLLNQRDISFHSHKDQVIFEANEVLKSDGKPYTVFTPYSRQWKKQLAEKDYQSYNYSYRNLCKCRLSDIPNLESIGFKSTEVTYSAPIINTERIVHYHEHRDIPSLQGTSELSVDLRFGTVSIRKLVQIAQETNETWLNELIWREFFKSILVHFPHVEQQSFKPKYDNIQWRNNEQEFQSWCEGRTGFPIVDAGMRQLKSTGLMHNRVRMICAGFLTKDLLIDWRWGEAWFARYLLDYDLSANNGNWQWAAGSGCDAAPYFRIFNPTEQTKRFDPKGIYIRKWVQDLDSYDYPNPIVDHALARKRALECYQNGLAEG